MGARCRRSDVELDEDERDAVAPPRGMYVAKHNLQRAECKPPLPPSGEEARSNLASLGGQARRARDDDTHDTQEERESAKPSGEVWDLRLALGACARGDARGYRGGEIDVWVRAGAACNVPSPSSPCSALSSQLP